MAKRKVRAIRGANYEKLLGYMHEHPGVEVAYADISKATGLNYSQLANTVRYYGPRLAAQGITRIVPSTLLFIERELVPEKAKATKAKATKTKTATSDLPTFKVSGSKIITVTVVHNRGSARKKVVMDKTGDLWIMTKLDY